MSQLFTKFLRNHALPLKSQGMSMLPILHPDDIVYFKKTSFSKINVDDLIVFEKKSQLISHRVIYKTKKYLIAKGDNALTNDGKIYSHQILGKIYQVKRQEKIIHPETLYLIQSTLYFQEIVKIKNAFDKENINYVFLKGLPLHLYFEKTQPKRIYADCDVLVDKKDFLKAQNILFSFSYQKADSSLTSFHKKSKKEVIENTYVKIVNDFGVAFDLHLKVVFMMTQLSHLDLLYPRSFLDQLTKDFLNYKKEIIIYQEKFLILDSRFLILYLALHLFHHNYRSAFRYQFLDKIIRSVLSQSPPLHRGGVRWGIGKLRKTTKIEVFWQDLEKMINRYQLNNFVYPTFFLLKKYYSTPIPQSFFISIKPTNWLTYQLVNRIIKKNIFDDDPRLKAGINRFLNLFLLSPSPWWRKIFVFFHPQVIYSIIWVVFLKGLSFKKDSPLFERFFAFILLVAFSPVFIILFFAVKFTSPGPFLFQQKRAGKNKKPFTIYKIRTMIVNAEKLKNRVRNEADGPVFKNFNDPRFTKIGRLISRLGIDELPQLINIVKGEMSFVGPRPLPVDEAEKIPLEYQKRFIVKPGIFSSWVAEGAFHNDFQRWMELDLKDVDNKSFLYDLKIFFRSVKFVFKLIKKLGK